MVMFASCRKRQWYLQRCTRLERASSNQVIMAGMYKKIKAGYYVVLHAGLYTQEQYQQ